MTYRPYEPGADPSDETATNDERPPVPSSPSRAPLPGSLAPPTSVKPAPPNLSGLYLGAILLATLVAVIVIVSNVPSGPSRTPGPVRTTSTFDFSSSCDPLDPDYSILDDHTDCDDLGTGLGG